MCARQPDQSGFVNSEGVPIYYEVHGDDGPAVLLLPAWAIAHSRIWKAQVPYLANHYRVVTFDPRGNGASGRPADPAAYDPRLQVGDALAVLDAVGIQRAVLAGNSFGTILAYLLAAMAPDRVAGAVLIGTTLSVDGRDDYPLARMLATFNEDRGVDEGWDRYNRHSFHRDFAGFVEFFVGQAFTDPHSTKHIEDGVSWGLETTPEVLAATLAGRADVPPAAMAARLRALAPQIRCPVLVVHGDADAIAPVGLGRSVAALLDVPIVELPGAGHCPQARYPVWVNRLLRRFIDDHVPREPRTRAPAPNRSGQRRTERPRVLFLSSPIGLGHARRDLAIARAARARARCARGLAGPGPRHPRARRPRRARPSGQRAAGQRVGAHRGRVRRPRPARVRG